MRFALYSLVLLSGCMRCGSDATTEGQPSASAAPVSAPPAPEDPDVVEVRALAMKFLEPGANMGALSEELVPREEDYDAVFLPEAADRMHQFYAPRFDRGELVIRPGPAHTNVLVYKATTEQIRNGEAPRFPGGYQNVGRYLQPELTLYVFVFVEEGRVDGHTYDGLVRVNDRWVIFPKLWQVLR
jgi:hypothetical protein